MGSIGCYKTSHRKAQVRQISIGAGSKQSIKSRYQRSKRNEKIGAKLTGDIIVQHAGPDRWIVSNVFTRSHVGVDGRGLYWLDALSSGHTPKAKPQTLGN